MGLPSLASDRSLGASALARRGQCRVLPQPTAHCLVRQRSVQEKNSYRRVSSSMLPFASKQTNAPTPKYPDMERPRVLAHLIFEHSERLLLKMDWPSDCR